MQKKIYELQNGSNMFLISDIITAVKPKIKKNHSHNHYEIIHFTPANHILYTDSKEYIMTSAGCAFIPPGTKHRTICKNTGKFRRILLNFKKEFAAPLCSIFNIDLSFFDSHTVSVLNDPQLKRLHFIFDRLLLEYKNNIPPQHNGRLKLYFTELLFLLSETSSQPCNENADITQINAVIDYMRNNCSENLTLDFLADKFYINKFDLCRKIKPVTGYNFSNCLTRFRMEHAVKLLTSTNLTVAQTAELAGYNSASYFTSVFKKSFGVAPKEYRRDFTPKHQPEK